MKIFTPKTTMYPVWIVLWICLRGKYWVIMLWVWLIRYLILQYSRDPLVWMLLLLLRIAESLLIMTMKAITQNNAKCKYSNISIAAPLSTRVSLSLPDVKKAWKLKHVWNSNHEMLKILLKLKQKSSSFVCSFHLCTNVIIYRQFW